MIVDHPFDRSTNPRNTGCVRCGRVADVHPKPVPTARRRDVAGELRIIRECARSVANPEGLIALSQARALQCAGEYVADPMTVKLGVNHDREALEEFADAASRLVWAMQEDPGSARSHTREVCLRYTAIIFDLLSSED